MPDFLKKASRQTAQVCDDDEERLAALFVRPGSGDQAKRLGAPDGKLGGLGSLADRPDEADVDGFASMFGQNAVLVLTTRRLLVFGHGALTGRVRDLVGEIDRGDIVDMALDAPPLGEKGVATLQIDFADGTSAVITPGSRRRRFVEAWADSQSPAH